MAQLVSTASGWFSALTLAERLASPSNGSTSGTTQIDPATAERRLARWRVQPPFSDAALFTRRLEQDRLTEDRLRALLGEPVDALAERHTAPAPWVQQILDAYGAIDEAPVGDERSLLDCVVPLLSRGVGRVRERIAALAAEQSNLPFDPATIEGLLLESFWSRLFQLLSRTLSLELNVARLEGRLAGETPEARHEDYARLLARSEETLRLFEEYPVLARQIVIAIDHWAAFSVEFLEQLCRDTTLLQAEFAPAGSLGRLIELTGGVGDSHRQGRSVRILRFDSGVRVVYKPRSLQLDVHFQELLTWLNGRAEDLDFRTLKVLDRGEHGWVEFIPTADCASEDAVRRFYRRQGHYLALLYALEATDFHLENLVAAGEHPVLLDLEALFHPRTLALDLTRAEEKAADALAYSVLRVGLLPQKRWGTRESDGIDLSGLGGARGQLMAQAAPTWEGLGTDEMRLVRRQLETAGAGNRPTLDGVEQEALDHLAEITAGFASAYATLLRHREELLHPEGPLTRFGGDEIRAILRPTQTYSVLLDESFHPDVLRDGLDRERLFDRLWVGVMRFPRLAEVIPAERDDLLVGDIPIFTTTADSCDLRDSRGRRLPAMFEESGLELVMRRVRQLSPTDLERQLWIIQASFASIAAGAHPVDAAGGAAHALEFVPVGAPASGTGPLAPSRLLELAGRAGDRLHELAFRGHGDASWIGLKPTESGGWVLTPLDLDLYDGLPGVALFLGYLGALSGEERHTELSRAALVTMRARADRGRRWFTALGGFAGWGGIIYTLAHLGQLWNDAALLCEAESLLDLIRPLTERDDVHDVIGGAAGCIPALLSLQAGVTSDRPTELALRCGDHLLASARRLGGGIGWMPRIGARVPLAGYSHGAAGIAAALAALARSTGESRFLLGAQEAIAYERTLFSPTAANWRDARDIPGEPDESPRYPVVWCHGAPGIGLGRLALLDLGDDAEIRDEVRVAVGTTLASGFGQGHSLCHGDLGNLELLTEAGRALGDAALADQAARAARSVAVSLGRDTWRCGNSIGAESPGFMTGISGIGYGLLRLARPDAVPSVLRLAPPAAPAARIGA